MIKEFVITNKGTKEFLSLNTGFCLMENKLDFYFFSLLLLTRVNRYLLGVSSFFYFPFFVTDKVPVPVQEIQQKTVQEKPGGVVRRRV